MLTTSPTKLTAPKGSSLLIWTITCDLKNRQENPEMQSQIAFLHEHTTFTLLSHEATAVQWMTNIVADI